MSRANMILIIIGFLFVVWGLPHSGFSQEDWKGDPDPAQYRVGFLAGLRTIKLGVRAPVRFLFGYKLLDDGWLSDVNDQVHLEFQGGPVVGMGSGEFAWDFGLGLRWHFQRTEAVGYYALGGLGMTFFNEDLVNTGVDWVAQWSIRPYFGVGIAWKVGTDLEIRAEYGYELLGAGLVFAL